MAAEEDLQKALEENRRLKARLDEIEGPKSVPSPIRPGTGQGATTDVTKMVKLLEQRDKRLETYAEELEEKQVELEKVVVELKKKNENLQATIGSLRLAQEILENDPTPTMGLNKEGRLLLFNRAAETTFGPSVVKALGKPIAELCPDLADGVEAALKDGRRVERDVRSLPGGTYAASILALGSQREKRGLVIRLTPRPPCD